MHRGRLRTTRRLRDLALGSLLCIAATAHGRPVNDDCASATVVTSLPFHDCGDTSDATAIGDPSLSCIGGAARAAAIVWYRFTPPDDSSLCARTCGSNYDTVLEIFDGSCESLQRTGLCNDDNTSACGAESLRSAINPIPAVAGHPILIAVAKYPNNRPGGYLQFHLARVGADQDQDGIPDCSDDDVDGDGIKECPALVGLTFPNPDPKAGDQFGAAVASFGTEHVPLLFAAPLADFIDGAQRVVPDAGAVYRYQFPGFGTDFGRIATTPGARLGSAVVEVDNHIAAGAPGLEEGQGVVYVFDPEPGVAMPLPLILEPPTPTAGDAFGFSLAALQSSPAVARPDLLLVGAPGTDAGEIVDAGAAYLFEITNGSLIRAFRNPSPSAGEQFGASVAAAGTDVLVGAPFNSDEARNAGAVYLLDGNTGQLLRTFRKSMPAAGDLFGAAVAALGDTIVIGAPFDDSGAQDAGAVYLFDRMADNQPIVLRKGSRPRATCSARRSRSCTTPSSSAPRAMAGARRLPAPSINSTAAGCCCRSTSTPHLLRTTGLGRRWRG